MSRSPTVRSRHRATRPANPKVPITAAEKQAAVVEATPPTPAPGQNPHELGLLWRDALIVVPYQHPPAGEATARTFAIAFAKRLKRTVEVRTKHRPNTVVLTIDEEYLASLRPSRAAAGPRAVRTEPTGLRAKIVEKAMSPEGASSKELLALTGWKVGPWKSVITTIADRYGYTLTIRTVDEEVRYFLTREQRQAA